MELKEIYIQINEEWEREILLCTYELRSINLIMFFLCYFDKKHNRILFSILYEKIEEMGREMDREEEEGGGRRDATIQYFTPK